MCGVWTIATLCWPVFQLPRWHHSSESCTQWHAPSWISSPVTVCLQLFKSCTGCQSLWEDPVQVVLAGWQVASGIHAGIHLRPSDIGCQYSRSIYTALRHVTTSSCRGHVDELATEPFLLLHCEHGTGYRRSWNCCDRRTHFVISISFYLWAPGCRLTLWCALGLLVGSAIQVPQLQLQLQCATTTKIKLLASAYCSLYTSYTTSCTSSACRAMERPSHYPVSGSHSGGYASGYPSTG